MDRTPILETQRDVEENTGMSDTGDLSKCDHGDRVMLPTWLYGMPDEWYETYFDLMHTNAFSLKWSWV